MGKFGVSSLRPRRHRGVRSGMVLATIATLVASAGLSTPSNASVPGVSKHTNSPSKPAGASPGAYRQPPLPAAIARYAPPPSTASYVMPASTAKVEAGGRGSIATTPRATAAQMAAAATRPVPAPWRDNRPNPDAGVRLPRQPLPTMGTLPPTIRPATTGFVLPGLTSSVCGGCGPSDSSAASTGSYGIETVNASIRAFTYSSTGSTITYTNTLAKLFNKTTGFFDPHVILDPSSNRFVVGATDGTNVYILYTSNATLSSWCTATLKGALVTGSSADFPNFGVNGTDIYATINEIGSTGVVSNQIWALGKAAMSTTNCHPVARVWRDVNDPGTSQLAHSIAPAVNYDYASDSTEELVDAYGGGGSHLSTYDIDANYNLHAFQVSVPSYSPGLPVPQKTATAKLDPDDNTIDQLVTTSLGDYAAHTGAYNGTNAIFWYQLSISTLNAAVETATGFAPPAGGSYFYPSLGENNAGNGMFTFMVAGTGAWPASAGISMDINHTYGSEAFLNIGTTYYRGAAGHCSGCYRWGDFSSSWPTGNGSSGHFFATQQDVLTTSTWGTIMGDLHA